MSHDHHGKQMSLTEQEMRELDSEAIQDEIESEAEAKVEVEAEMEEESREEVEAELIDIIEAGTTETETSPRRRRLLARIVIRQSVRAVCTYTRAVVRRMLRNAALRRKLAAASRRGPRAVRVLVGVAVLRAMPKPFRRGSRRLVGLAITMGYRNIARQAGLAPHEIDAAELKSERM